MIKCSKTTIRLFDKWRLAVPDKLETYQDGPLGKRVVFITDVKERFCISFEEDMPMMDMLLQTQRNGPSASFQYCKNGKYIHLRRGSEGRVPCAFFHMELEDSNGAILSLPGQMVVSPEYRWSDSIEPVLLDLLENLSAEGEEGCL